MKKYGLTLILGMGALLLTLNTSAQNTPAKCFDKGSALSTLVSD